MIENVARVSTGETKYQNDNDHPRYGTRYIIGNVPFFIGHSMGDSIVNTNRKHTRNATP